jgi:hypothetical protein
LVANIQNSFEPLCDEKARQRPEWEKATQVKHEALTINQAWMLKESPTSKKAIGCKWVYKVKYKIDGTHDKHEARLAANSFP